MTPEQSARACAVLRQHTPSDPAGYAACLEAIEHLQRLARPSVTWDYDPSTRTLHAGEGGRDRLLLNVGDFAADVALAWRAYPNAVDLAGSVVFDDATRATLKARRHALAARMRAAHMPTLAQAVQDVLLRQSGQMVSAIYSPEAVPVCLK